MDSSSSSSPQSAAPSFKAPPIYNQRYQEIIKALFDEKSPLFIESLLDLVTALGYSTAPKSVRDDKFFKIFVAKYNETLNTLFKRVALSDFEIKRKIGAGAFGAVFLVKEKYSGSYYALKKVSKFALDLTDSALFTSFFTEKDIMMNSHSPWIPKLFYSFQDAKNLFYTMEFLPAGTLDDLIDACYPLKPEYFNVYAAQTCLGITAVHEAGYIHRDVKTDNFIVTSQGLVKITDFGLALKLNANKRWSTIRHAGTTEYMSPELFESMEYNHCRDFGLETDWWACGVLLYCLRAGYTPYQSVTGKPSTTAIRNHDLSTMVFDTDDDGIPFQDLEIDLIKKMLAPEDTRIGYKEAAAHPIFKELDLATLHKKSNPWVPGVSEDVYKENENDIVNFDESKYYMADKFQGEHIPFAGFTQIKGIFSNSEISKLKRSKTLKSKTSLFPGSPSSSSSPDSSKKLQEMEESVKKLKEVNHSQIKEIDSLKKKNAEVRERMEEVKKKHNNLEEKYSNAKSKKQNFKLECSQLERDKEDLMASLEHLHNEKQAAEEAKKLNDESTNRIKCQLTETEQKYDVLCKELKDLQYKLSESEIKLRQAESQKELAAAAAAAASADSEASTGNCPAAAAATINQADVQNLRNDIELKQTQLLKKDEEISDLEGSHKVLKRQLLEVNEQRDKLEATLKTTQFDLSQIIQKESELSEKHKRSTEVLMKTTQEYNASKKERDALRTKVNALGDAQVAMKLQFDAQVDEINRLETLQKSSAKELAIKIKELEQMAKKNKEISKSLKNEKERSNEEIEHKDGEIKELTSKNRIAENEIHKLNQQNQQFMKLTNLLSSQPVDKKQGKGSVFKSRRNNQDDKGPEVKKLKVQLEKKEEELVNVKNENTKLRDEICDIIRSKDDKIYELSQTISILEQNLKQVNPLMVAPGRPAKKPQEASNEDQQASKSSPDKEMSRGLSKESAESVKIFTDKIVAHIKANMNIFKDSIHSYCNIDELIFEVSVTTPPKSSHLSLNTSNYNQAIISLMLKENLMVFSVLGHNTVQCHMKSVCLLLASDNKKVDSKFGNHAMRLCMGINSNMSGVQPSNRIVKMADKFPKLRGLNKDSSSNTDGTSLTNAASQKRKSLISLKSSKSPSISNLPSDVTGSIQNLNVQSNKSGSVSDKSVKHNFVLSNVKSNLESCAVCRKHFIDIRVPIRRCTKCNLAIHSDHDTAKQQHLGKCESELISTLVIFDSPELAIAWKNLFNTILTTTPS